MLCYNGVDPRNRLVNSSTGLKPFLKSPYPKLGEFKIKPVKFEHWAKTFLEKSLLRPGDSE